MSDDRLMTRQQLGDVYNRLDEIAEQLRLAQMELNKAADGLADRRAEYDQIRSLLVECDSELSAYGHGRPLVKAKALELSDKCRVAAEALKGKS